MAEPTFDRTERWGRAIGSFLSVRPIFGPLGLKTLWWTYLFYEALNLTGGIIGAYLAYQSVSEQTSSFLLPAVVERMLVVFSVVTIPLIRLALVRAFLEVVAIYLSRHSERFREGVTIGAFTRLPARAEAASGHTAGKRLVSGRSTQPFH